jgi:hypothetical protein
MRLTGSNEFSPGVWPDWRRLADAFQNARHEVLTEESLTAVLFDEPGRIKVSRRHWSAQAMSASATAWR